MKFCRAELSKGLEFKEKEESTVQTHSMVGFEASQVHSSRESFFVFGQVDCDLGRMRALAGKLAGNEWELP